MCIHLVDNRRGGGKSAVTRLLEQRVKASAYGGTYPIKR